MTTDQNLPDRVVERETDARVYRFPAGDRTAVPGDSDVSATPEVVADTSFEIDLDDGADTPAMPLYVDAIGVAENRRPIIPEHLRTVQGVRSTVKKTADRAAYRAGVHAVRSPVYLAQVIWYGMVGLFRLLGRQIGWWWDLEQFGLRQEAANTNDPITYLKLRKESKVTRSFRGFVLLGQVVALLLGVVVLLAYTPTWVAWMVALVAVGTLARFGRPVDKPIIKPAIVTPRLRKLTADIVLHAYYKAKLGDPDKPGQQVTFGSTMARDALNAGSQVLVDLPYGRTFSDAVNARERIASGLDVNIRQVYLTPDHSSNRRHLLWVADVDPLSLPAGPTPLLNLKPRDVWAAAPMGLDERGRRVLLPLMWTSVLIGAQPRKGKTFTARNLALFVALDPYVRLSVFDAKGSPDWRRFALVAHTYGFGMLPDDVQGDPVENLRATLRAAKREVQDRNIRLSQLPTSVCPEGKLTREIARDRTYNMPVWVIVLDEFQDYLNTGDEDVDLEIAQLLVFLIKQGPSAGVLFIDSTQRPSGIGSTGKVAKLFTDFRDNHQTRFALKTSDYNMSGLILGAGAYGEGYDSSVLPVGDGSNGTPDYRGIGILYAAPVDNAIVRGFMADGNHAETILTAARRFREKAGTLDGMAAGERVTAQARDVLADTLDVFLTGEVGLSWAEVAERLAEQLPERYASVTGDAISATLRNLKLGIESKNVRVGEQVLKGVQRASLDRAMHRRMSDDSR